MTIRSLILGAFAVALPACAPALKADLAIFDPARVRDPATFERPHQYAEGFSVVIVNGEVVLDAGRVTSARPGQVLYGAGRR
jgi:N-acyl-D-aspartate/D-glutamate deacylase